MLGLVCRQVYKPGQVRGDILVKVLGGILVQVLGGTLTCKLDVRGGRVVLGGKLVHARDARQWRELLPCRDRDYVRLVELHEVVDGQWHVCRDAL